jgi:acetyl esterase/lipase
MRTDFGGGGPGSRVLGLVLRHSARPVIGAWTLTPRLPWPYFLVDQVGRLQRKAPGTVIEPVALAHCRAELISTPASDTDRFVVYFHGGAFLVGGRRLHHALISRIAQATRSTVLAVEYRKLPRHAVHVSAEDGLDAYRHVLSLGVPAGDIVFMGDSAGGFLTFTVADLAAARGLPAPAALVAMSPLVDLDLARTPLALTRRGCAVFGARAIPTFARLALRRAGPRGLHSPPDCALATLPPVLLQVSSAESLYGQVCALADLLAAAGVPVELQVWDGQVHVFQAARLLPEAQQAVAELAAYVERMVPLRTQLTA